MAAAAAPPPDNLLAKARSRNFDICYEVNPEAQPLKSVELWYTFDEGRTWHRHGVDDDAQSPMVFTAPQEGVCGLYFVLTNVAGGSGPPPESGTAPQKWLLIDYTPPIAQLHPPRLEPLESGGTVVHLTWTVIDTHLPDRPIALEYRTAPDGDWRATAEALPNTGRFDWRIPEDATGRLFFRMTVRDRAGNTSQAAAVPVDARPAALTGEGPTAAKVAAGPTTRPATGAEKARAQSLLRKADEYSSRGDHAAAVGVLREALKLDPGLPGALVKLGGALYAGGRFDESAEAYRLSLRSNPVDRPAILGLASTELKLRRYDQAEGGLLKLIERDPKDAEAWLQMGDVAVYQGNEVNAVNYYIKAATLDPQAEAIVQRAHDRLRELAVPANRAAPPKPTTP